MGCVNSNNSASIAYAVEDLDVDVNVVALVTVDS